MYLNDTSTPVFPFRNGFVFRGCAVWVGEFLCHHEDPKFSGQHFFKWHHMIVFPRTTVKLRFHGQESFVGSPNVAVFYNQETVYERYRISGEGDQCNHFHYDPIVMDEMVSAYLPIKERDKRPFPFTHAYISQENFLRQRKIVDLIHADAWANRLQIDETAILLLESLLEDSFQQQGIKPKKKQSTQRFHRELAIATQELLAKQFAHPLSLQQIALALHVSPYHLSRVFRQQTGCTLHHYLEQLRLRMAHQRLGDYADNLTQLALDVGYSTHSHFTSAFHRSFGSPPSSLLSSRSELT